MPDTLSVGPPSSPILTVILSRIVVQLGEICRAVKTPYVLPWQTFVDLAESL